MALMILPTLPVDATPGERRVYEALASLPDSYAVCYRRLFPGRRHVPKDYVAKYDKLCARWYHPDAATFYTLCYPIMVRGRECRVVFRDDTDREDCSRGWRAWRSRAGARTVFASALLPNKSIRLGHARHALPAARIERNSRTSREA